MALGSPTVWSWEGGVSSGRGTPVGIVPLQVSRGALFLISEVPLWCLTVHAGSHVGMSARGVSILFVMLNESAAR